MADLSPQLESYLDHLRASGAAGSTLRGYRTDLLQLQRWMQAAGVPLEAADTAVLRRYAAYLGTLRYAPATASRKLSAMRGAYAWLFARDLVPRDPAAVVPGPKQRRTLPATFKPSELDQLLDPTGRRRSPRRFATARCWSCSTAPGCARPRPAPCASRDVDRVRRQVRVTGKGDKQRMVPLGGAAEQALDRYLARGRPALDRGLADRLFLSVRGRPLQPSDVRRSLERSLTPSRAGVALTARAAAFICHSSSRGRCRSPEHPGDAWPRIRGHDPGIHPRERAAS